MMFKLFIFTMVLVAAVWGVTKLSDNRKPLGSINTSPIMQISSNVFANDSTIPTIYTCNGEGVNPPVQFGGVSSDAKSLALILDDPDATPTPYTHWIVFNMSPKIGKIEANSKPAGVLLKNTSGLKDYVPLCPPSGIHRYVFTLYALDSMLEANTIYNQTDLTNAMMGHIIDKAQLYGRFSKK